MHLRTSAGRRPVLFTLVLAASLALPVIASVHSRRSIARGAAAGVKTPDSPATPPAALSPGAATARVEPKPAPAASIRPALTCEASCADNDPCTVDRCDPTTGQCVHPAVVCEDFNPCTVDSCEPDLGCRFAPVPDGIECGTNPCMAPSLCQAGECVQGHTLCDDGNDCTNDSCDATGQCEHFAYTCDDGNGCTLDACDAATGQCHHTLLPEGASCDDHNACTTATSCHNFGMGVQCVGTTTPGAACNDQNPCTINDLCLDAGPGYSYCQGTYRDCNDSDECTQDYCDGNTGQCQHPATQCDDRNPCTIDSCDPATGCHNSQLEVGSACDDLNGCTVDDECRFGNNGFNCYGTATPGAACDDLSPCTTGDTCQSQFGNVYCAGTYLECSDGNACTNDTCSYLDGGCISGPAFCNDFNSCTDDSCSMESGCQHAPHPEGSVCDDLNTCSTGDVCQGGRCVGPVPVTCDDQRACTLDYCDPKGAEVSCLHLTVDCDDGNPCTDDSCREPDGTCLFVPRPDGEACDDHSACTQGESCQGGQCAATGTTACDDGNPCTTDVCDPATGGCLFLPISCDDGNGCTADSCDVATGQCVHSASPCDDGDACTDDLCDAAGQCQHTPTVCNDGNVCTIDSCDPATGCTASPGPDGKICDDRNACTSQDRCSAGQCVGVPLHCDDGNTCTVDSCDPREGRCRNLTVPDGTSCDDHDACTQGDQCAHGQCISGGPPPACDDGSACTRDSCDPATGSCRFLAVACDDGNPCTADSCDPGSGCHFDPLPNGTACPGHDLCVTGESCQYGQCLGVAKNCDDGETCTYDYCDGSTGLCHHNSSCDDGNPCTDDFCGGEVGGCTHVLRDPGSACDDGNVCTTDDACVATEMGVTCQGTITPGAACDDQNPCTHDDLCQVSGTQSYCQGTVVECGDGEICNRDYCDPQTGQCAHDPLNCDDRNPCTIDSCGPAEGQCTHQAVAQGTSCNDPSGCLTGSTCTQGPKGGMTCSGGTPSIGAPCDDHNSCTDLDRCKSDGRGGALCAGGAGVNCEDGLSCTIDYCDPSIGACRQQPATCDDGDACTLNACSEEGGGTCTAEPASLHEVSELDFTTQTGFGWSATPAAEWNSYRGTIPIHYLGSRLPGSVYDHVCFESADAASNGPLGSSDAEDPPPGTAFYYDATAESSCGEGPLGKDSAGNVRPNPAPCPTPP
ncbi:MAG TPA: hypothetical protein VFC25_14955 [Verrucomicrobiae bacterium]|nr:hypothetical protein [Verrucomicrobiae bacterium]